MSQYQSHYIEVLWKQYEIWADVRLVGNTEKTSSKRISTYKRESDIFR